MPLHRLPAADRPAVPWRNGGGLTREIAAAPDGSWRLSLAEIAADGPFSEFPGLDRLLTVVSGAGLELTVGQAPPVTVPPLCPFAFAGEARTHGRLPAGPVGALNVMTTRALAATVEIVTGTAELSPEPGATLLAVTLDGFDAVQLTHPATARVTDAAVVTIRTGPSAGGAP